MFGHHKAYLYVLGYSWWKKINHSIAYVELRTVLNPYNSVQHCLRTHNRDTIKTSILCFTAYLAFQFEASYDMQEHALGVFFRTMIITHRSAQRQSLCWRAFVVNENQQQQYLRISVRLNTTIVSQFTRRNRFRYHLTKIIFNFPHGASQLSLCSS